MRRSEAMKEPDVGASGMSPADRGDLEEVAEKAVLAGLVHDFRHALRAVEEAVAEMALRTGFDKDWFKNAMHKLDEVHVLEADLTHVALYGLQPGAQPTAGEPL